ncbi:MAG: hypothetical protein ABSE06_11860 [Anaerolineaceae bacterium]
MVGIGQSLVERALYLFRRQKGQASSRRLWMFFFRRSARLRSFDEAVVGARIESSHFAGARPVPIDKIRGSLGKTGEFDDQFHPTREEDRTRWLEVAIARLSGRDLPAVDLIELDGFYYVRDGHHRISVAQALGQQYIDAEITRMHITHTPL